MKVRNGFVSNSSSSSFCLFGVCKSSDDWEEILRNMGKEPTGDTGYDISSLLNDSFFFYSCGLSEYPDDYIIVGAEPEAHRDSFGDKTFIEYEEIVREEFKKLFGDGDYTLDFYTDGGYNG